MARDRPRRGCDRPGAFDWVRKESSSTKVEKKKKKCFSLCSSFLKCDVRWLERHQQWGKFPLCCTSAGSRWLRGGSFSNRTPALRLHAQSESNAPPFCGYQCCSCWGRGRKSRVTQGVIVMGPVMRVDRLMHGGGWALTRCCLQIGFLQVRHPRRAISPFCAATFFENDLLLSKWSAAGPTVNPSTLSWCALGYHTCSLILFWFFFWSRFPVKPAAVWTHSPFCSDAL